MDYFEKAKKAAKKYTVLDLIPELLDAATKVHILHLSVTGPGSYAQHIALNELYDALPDLVDAVAESWQGVTGEIPKYKPNQAPTLNSVSDCIDYLEQIHQKITNAQKTIKYSEIVNDLDNIKSQLNKTKYKLKFLT